MLAQNTPLSIVKKNVDHFIQIEALLFGQSGLLPQKSDDAFVRQLIKEYDYMRQKYQLNALNPSMWKFSKIHPPSFPTMRLAQWAYFFVPTCKQFNKFAQYCAV